MHADFCLACVTCRQAQLQHFSSAGYGPCSSSMTGRMHMGRITSLQRGMHWNQSMAPHPTLVRVLSLPILQTAQRPPSLSGNKPVPHMCVMLMYTYTPGTRRSPGAANDPLGRADTHQDGRSSPLRCSMGFPSCRSAAHGRPPRDLPAPARLACRHWAREMFGTSRAGACKKNALELCIAEDEEACASRLALLRSCFPSLAELTVRGVCLLLTGCLLSRHRPGPGTQFLRARTCSCACCHDGRSGLMACLMQLMQLQLVMQQHAGFP